MQQTQLSPINKAYAEKAKENQDFRHYTNILSASNDKFETKTSSENETKLNTYTVDAKSNINFSEKIKIKTSYSSLEVRDIKKEYESQLKQKDQIIKKYKEVLLELSFDKKIFEILKNNKVKYYQRIANNAILNYKPPTLPQKEDKTNHKFEKSFPFKETSNLVNEKESHDYIQKLSEILNEGDDIKIPYEKKPNSPEVIEKAKLDSIDSNYADCTGKSQLMGLRLDYGSRMNWSDEKIARDILQNFFDANNHSLDNVGILIEPDGDKFKIKISGNGVYDCGSLLELGSGNKLEEDPFNAGGFGEGSRMVVASLLGQNKTNEVNFACADWKTSFYPDGKSIKRKIDRISEILDGNYIEFESSDKNFVRSLIKSIDFFNHSENPDFKNLTFENNDFGFKILKPGEKGNLYVTQRFEYDKNGNWDGGVEGLNLIFKRKPDFEEYKKITGKKFNTGRDRTALNADDVYDLTKCFASKLSDEQLIDSILNTEIQWNSIESKEKSAIKYFINALCDIAEVRNIGIDFQDSNYCKYNREDDITCKFVEEKMGYRILPSDLNLDKVGMLTVREVLEKSSKHEPIGKLSEVEIKKLKLLEEAIRVIQEAISKSYAKKLKFIYNDSKDTLHISNEFHLKRIAEILPDDCTFAQKYRKPLPVIVNEEKFLNKCTKELIEFFDEKIPKISSGNLNENENKKIIDAFCILLEISISRNELLSQYLTQVKNLQIISKADIKKPRFVFDRHSDNEILKGTLAEAIIESRESKYQAPESCYEGHWIDKSYLDCGDFYDLVATWLHEISHKSGGDGTHEFTYKLTDVIEALTRAIAHSPDLRINLAAIEEVFNKLS